MELPKRQGEEQPQLPTRSRQILIIGANGAGKSRFTARLVGTTPSELVFPLSVRSYLFRFPKFNFDHLEV